MDSWSNYSNRQTSREEQLLYAHFLERLEVDSPNQLIERFRCLFIQGTGYPNPQIRQALEQLVTSKVAEREFKFILNRCCYILINRWLNQSQCQGAVPKLVAVLETSPSGMVRSRTTQRLRELVRQFTLTEQYQALRRLAQVLMSQTADISDYVDTQPLRTYIRRYPCLYEYCLLTNDSPDEQRQKVRAIRAQVEQQFAVDLSRYVSYWHIQRLRAGQMNGGVANNNILLPNNLRPAKNPTLLNDDQLELALKQFLGKVDGSHTYRDLARQFLTYNTRTGSYRTFKEELYKHLTAAIDPRYGRYQFNQLLYKQLQNTLSQNDTQILNDALLLRTCRKLLDFLVVESSQRPNHYIFSDLVSNLGISGTIGLLLKIVLLCHPLKSHLEKQFSILFNHYEACPEYEMRWLVESLENLNIAFCTHFGGLKRK